MIVTTTELLAREPASTEAIREAISGNLCL
jgi:aerobic-type carbon monoxide dehydrogenase small subunit (CoxS/CutS family)